LRVADPESRVLDVAMTAFPAQPLCWSFVSVESREVDDSYRLRRGVLSLAPDWLPAARCPSGLADAAPRVAAAPGVELSARIDGSLSELRRARAGNCWFDAWMRFARMPALVDGVATDVRFVTTPRGNFTTLDVTGSASRACPSGVPHWVPPRTDLLAPR
jgi:inner membrane protein